ncbi:MAG TPA: hypothetical protein VFD70_28210 [Anaerolineae bacterium]|nr:hypothetical protein [Anaerolineae bacterium]
MSVSKSILYYGTEEPLTEWRELRAGPLTLTLEASDLRYIRLGDVEVLRRVYVALRDVNWNTIPATFSNWQLDIRPDSFEIAFDAEHVTDEIDFFWRGTIRGERDGTILYTMDGEVRKTFLRSRIGFCVLHGLEAVGKPFHARHVDGSESNGIFPVAISPHTPVKNLKTIKHQVRDGIWALVEFEGETFEMEDQRNWTDASFKTYSTPLELPYPVEVRAGEKINQSVRLSLEGATQAISATPTALTITLSPRVTKPLPSIGLGLASHGEQLDEREFQALDALQLSHLRVDLDLSSPDYKARLERASAQAKRLQISLEIALHLTDVASTELQELRKTLEQIRPPIQSWLILKKGEWTTPAAALARAREMLASYDSRAPFGGGTNADLVYINRFRPPLDALDFVFYSINAQVHAFDVASIAETLEAQAMSVETAKRISGSKPVHVTPITLRPRFNAAARGPEPLPPPGELPWQVDPRQMSLFGAGWTAGSIKYLAEAGANSTTYFETTGWGGVMETEQGSTLPEKFHSTAGMLFPLYHVLADVGELRGGQVFQANTSNPLTANCLAMRAGNRTRLLVFNLTGNEQQVTIQNLNVERAHVHRLNEKTFEQATEVGVNFQHEAGAAMNVTRGCVELALLPFEVARLDY